MNGNLTFQQIEQIWIDNGGNAALAPIMAAIAMAESGGNPNAIGDNGTSYGLWQIHWTVHPQFNPSQLFNPSYNANAAQQLSGNGNYLSPWTTFLNGAYQQYLPGGSYVPSQSSSQVQEAGYSQQGMQWGLLGPLGVLFDILGGKGSEIFSNVLVSGFAVILILIGALWIIFGNEGTRKVFVAKATDALV